MWAQLFIAALLLLTQSGLSLNLRDRLPLLEIPDGQIHSFVDELRRNDENRASPSQIQLDYQGHTSTRDDSDNARSALFKHVDESVLRRSTYAKLMKLYDNYNFETGIAEHETAEESAEVKEFIDAIMQTKPIKMLVRLLKQKGYPIADNEQSFRSWLQQLWFGHYSRARGQPDSSGFEHVFIGEAKNGELSGLHNWVRFYYLERKGRSLDYKGFLVKRFNVMAAIKYSVGNVLKRSGSFLLGTSPEFDMALYTLCFLARRGHFSTCNFEVDGCPVSITSFELKQQGKIHIGSMYPSAGRITAQCRARNE